MMGVRASAGASLASAAAERIAERAAPLHDHEKRRSARKTKAKSGEKAKIQREKQPVSRVDWKGINHKSVLIGFQNHTDNTVKSW